MSIGITFDLTDILSKQLFTIHQSPTKIEHIIDHNVIIYPLSLLKFFLVSNIFFISTPYLSKKSFDFIISLLC